MSTQNAQTIQLGQRIDGLDQSGPPRVLVVDETQLTRRILRALLHRRQYRVVEVSNGEEAIRHLCTTAFDVVVMDTMIPDLSGIELLKAIRRIYSGSELPIILATERHETRGIVEALELGANDCVVKPFDFQVLLARIKTQVATKRAEDALRRANRYLERTVEERTTDLLQANSTLKKERAARNQMQAERKRSAEQLERSLVSTVRAVSLAAEKRDPYTAGHQRRAADLATAIASELGLSDHRTVGLQLGTTIHDIGKIYCPGDILNRPGKLSDAEFGLVKSHPQVGFEIIKDVRFPWPVGQMILQHHERLDGSGYPNGLKGTDVILEARILAVADVMDAMVSHRPYRPALPLEEGLEEISRHKGTRYDPDVVDACLKLFLEKGFSLGALAV